MLLIIIITIYFNQFIKGDPGVSVNCGKDTCDSCYGGVWELGDDGICRIADCTISPDDQLSNLWCQSCKPGTPFVNYQRMMCVKSDCSKLELKDSWCADCSDDPTKIMDYDQKVCANNCQVLPENGKYTSLWCQLCAKPRIYVNQDRTGCRSADCDSEPQAGKYTNQYCSNCVPKKPFANEERNGCQIIQVDRDLFSSLLSFKSLFFICLVILFYQ